MSIRYIEETKHLILETKNSGYHMKIDHLGYLQHMYYGPKPGQDNLSYAFRYYDRGFSGNPYDMRYDRTYSLDSMPQEYTSFGVGDFRVNSIAASCSDGSRCAEFKYVSHEIVSGKLSMTIDAGTPGKFNVYNALAAAAVCLHFDVTAQDIFDGLNEVKVKGRVEPVNVPGNFTLLIDYAHNAVSMENILETLREYSPKRLITLFGAGGNRPRDRRYEMGEISGKLSDLSVITEDNSRFEDVNDIIEDIKTGIKKTDGKYIVIPDRTEAIRYCIENAQDGDIIVLAGKGHEDYQDKNGVKTHYDEREVIAKIINGEG